MDLVEHKRMLERWSTLPAHGKGTFISDGPIDPDSWRTVGRRVLFLAKEAYGDVGRGNRWDLPTLVRDEWKGPKYKFWWTLGYWAYGIQRLTDGPIPASPISAGLWREVSASVMASALVNVKKSRGRSLSDDDDLRRYVAMDKELLGQQVKCLNPHIVVCCNTWKLLKDEVWPFAERVSERVHRIDDMLVLDYWHPANRFPDVMGYYAALVLLQRALFL